MAVSYKTKFAAKLQTELDLVLCFFDPTEMGNMHILRTKQNKNILRLFFFAERKIFGEGIFCLETSLWFKLEWVHRMATTTVRRCLWGCTCPVRRGWRNGACSVRRKRQLWGVMRGLEAPQYMWKGPQEDGPRVFTVVHGRRTRDNRQKLRKEGFRLHVKENIFVVAQRACVVSVIACFQELTEQPGLIPLLTLLRAGHWTRDHLISLPTWTVLWSYEKYSPILKYKYQNT